MEVLQESSIELQNRGVTTLKDEIFLLCYRPDRYYVIKVYNRDNLKEVKDVIRLPGTDAQHMTGCNVSNCLYISLRQGDSLIHDTLRISRDVDHKFNISPWIDDRRMMSVTANGGIIICSKRGGRHRDVVRIYNADGSLQHEMKLSRYVDVLTYKNIIQKANGNLVLSYLSIRNNHIGLTLLELNLSGSVVRQFHSSIDHNEEGFLKVADENDRIMICTPFDGIELLDSEFNLLGIFSLPRDQLCAYCRLNDVHYNRSRNEIVSVHLVINILACTNVLTISRFAEE